MPSMASITVKKYDGTTDIVYDAISASSGSEPAVWRQDTGADPLLPVGFRPTLKVHSKDNGKKTARQVVFEFTMPYGVVDTNGYLFTNKDQVVATGIITLPRAIPQGNLQEAVQFLNLMASTLMKQSVAVGYAPV